MKKSIGGLFNKFSPNSSGKLEAGASLRDDTDDEQRVEYRRKSASDGSEEFKIKKSFSLKVLSPFKTQEPSEPQTGETDFNKKKSSSMRTVPSLKDSDKEKLNASADNKIKKSFSLRGVKSFDRGTDSPKSSLKNMFASQYNQQSDFEEGDSSSSDDDQAQAVPKKVYNRPRVNSTHDDFDDAQVAVPRLISSPFLSTTSAIPPHLPPSPANPPSPMPNPRAASAPPVLRARSPPVDANPEYMSNAARDGDGDASMREFGDQFTNDDMSRMRSDSITMEQYERARAESISNEDGNLIVGPGGTLSSFAFPFTSKSRKLTLV